MPAAAMVASVMGQRGNAAATADREAERAAMVERQLMARGVRDLAVLAAMRSVPREVFVPDGLAEFAYDDRPLPVQAGQTISQPYVVGLAIEALGIGPDDRVLEIGSGTGYAVAVLARIAREVYGVERHGELVEAARRRLSRLGLANVGIVQGDGTKGLPEHAPYDAILVSAGGPSVPQTLREQLAVGGRLVIPIGRAGDQELVRVTRRGEAEWEEQPLGGVSFVPLIGEQGWQTADSSPLGSTASAPAPGSAARAGR
jgi:protein-L-isoaspartate(D-aspartate) O-methyltransferase